MAYTESNMSVMIFFRFYLFLEKGEERGKREGREKNTDVQEIHRLVASCTSPTGDLAHHLGMCPDQESNQRPFGSQTGTQSTEPCLSGLSWFLTIYS